MEQLTIRLMEELRKNAILLRRCFLHPGPQVGQNSRLLTILLENPGISQRALSDLLHIRPQSLGEQLTKLMTLALGDNNIVTAPDLSKLDRLGSLDLSDNNLEDASGLKDLNPTYPGMSDDDIEADKKIEKDDE